MGRVLSAMSAWGRLAAQGLVPDIIRQPPHGRLGCEAGGELRFEKAQFVVIPGQLCYSFTWYGRNYRGVTSFRLKKNGQ